MIAQAIHETAGVGVGTFLGILLVLGVMRFSGREVSVLRNSVLFTALVAGMSAWILSAVVRSLMG